MIDIATSEGCSRTAIEQVFSESRVWELERRTTHLIINSYFERDTVYYDPFHRPSLFKKRHDAMLCDFNNLSIVSERTP